MSIVPFWLPSALNPADAPSRAGYENEETLSPVLFAQLSARWGPFSLDALASAVNAQCPRYLSRFPSAAAVGCDVFAFPLGSVAVFVTTELMCGDEGDACAAFLVIARSIPHPGVTKAFRCSFGKA